MHPEPPNFDAPLEPVDLDALDVYLTSGRAPRGSMTLSVIDGTCAA
jgi:hypothetical protein